MVRNHESLRIWAGGCSLQMQIVSIDIVRLGIPLVVAKISAPHLDAQAPHVGPVEPTFPAQREVVDQSKALNSSMNDEDDALERTAATTTAPRSKLKLSSARARGSENRYLDCMIASLLIVM